MAGKMTPERQKLKRDAVKIRQELGWSQYRIATHLSLPRATIKRWVGRNGIRTMGHHAAPLDLGIVHAMDCIKGMNSLAHESIDLVFADPPYNIGVDYGNGTTLDRYGSVPTVGTKPAMARYLQ